MTHPLRGRSAELGSVLGALRAGAGPLVVVRGEPGIGKTAFVQAVVEQAARAGRVVGCSTARPGDNVTPLASLGPALRSGPDPVITSAEFLALAPLTGQPLWLAEHLAGLLERRAERHPLLVVLDDAQWADPLSTFMLRVLVPRLAALPVGWLLATRDVLEGPVDQVLTPGSDALRIDLSTVDDDAVLEIAADHLGRQADPALARRLIGTGGVPFLLVQLLAGLLEPGAGGLVDGVRRRTATTSDQCRALLRTGAVLGTAFTLEDAARLLGEPAARLIEPLDEAIRAGLLADDGTTVVFRHDLLRQAVYEDIPPSVRAAVHRTVVDHLLATGRGHAEAAPHVLATAVRGDTRAVDVLRKAAHEVLGTMSVTSMLFIRQAFELVEDTDPLWGEVGRDVVAVLVTARHQEDAAAFARHLFDGVPAPDVRAEVRLLLSPWWWATGRHDQLLADPDPAAAPALRARLSAYQAAAADRPVDEVPDDPVAAVVTLAAAATRAERDGSYQQAADLYAEALALGADEVGSPSPWHLGLRLAVVRSHLDDFDAARAWLAEAATDSWQAPRLAWLRAHLALGEGRPADARTAALDAVRLMDHLHDHLLDAEVRQVLVTVALLRGDLPEARAHLAAAERRGGRAPVLRALLDHPADLVDAVAGRPVPWKVDLLVAALPGSAAAVADLASRNPGVTSLAGAAALAAGDHESAVRLLRSSPRPLLLARAEEEHGRALLESGPRSAAVAALDRARDLYADLGATAPAARVQRTLHAAGARRRRWNPVPRRPDTGWDALTATERRIALLVAAGHTNRSAAEELVVSPSTVGTHLRAVFTKLDVNSRVQLTRLVLQRETPPAP